MATAAYIGDPISRDHGGGSVAIRITWEGGDTAWTKTEQCKLRLYILTGPATFVEALIDGNSVDLYSGVPGGYDDANGYVIYPTPTHDPVAPGYLRFLKGRSPRIAPGVYWVGVLRLASGVWTPIAYAASPFRVLPRLRHEEVYLQRRRNPHPYSPGAWDPKQEAIIEG